jgi:hypothetical protein
MASNKPLFYSKRADLIRFKNQLPTRPESYAMHSDSSLYRSSLFLRIKLIILTIHTLFLITHRIYFLDNKEAKKLVTSIKLKKV